MNTCKKNLLIVFAIISSCLLASCTDAKKEFIKNLSDAMEHGQKDSIAMMYPDAAKCEAFRYELLRVENLQIEEDEKTGEFKVLLDAGKSMVVKTENDGTMKVKESFGLFKFDEKDLDFAKKTGQVEEGMNDKTTLERLSDTGFNEWLSKSFVENIKNSLKASISGTYGDDYYEGEWLSCEGTLVTVKNTSEYNIPASAYVTISRNWYWGDPSSKNRIKNDSKDIPAKGSVTLRSRSEANTETDNDVLLEVNEEELINLFHETFTPHGNEYQEYLGTKL